MTQHINRQDQAIRKRAAILSVVMHVFLLAAMIFMVDWKDAHVNPSVMEATLWDSLPSKAPPEPVIQPPEPTPPPPASEPPPKPEPVPEPEPPKKVTPPEPQVNQAEQDAEIALKKLEEEKKRKIEEEKKKEDEKKKRELQVKRLQEVMLKDDENEKINKLKQSFREEDLDTKQESPSIADPGIVDYFAALMKRKIRSNVNPTLCPVSVPELSVEMQLTATGDVSGVPKLVNGSGNPICDDAVIRAILASKPFDLPSTENVAERKRMLEQIRLKFRPRG